MLPAQHPFESSSLLNASVVGAGYLVDEENASGMDWVVQSKGFDAEKMAEFLVLGCCE